MIPYFLLSALLGQTPPEPNQDRDLQEIAQILNTPVITASKWPSPLEHSPATMFILTRKDIRLMAATSLPDLLRTVPGLDVMVAGDPEVIVGARGLATFQNAKLLVLLDGHRMNLEFTGGVRWKEIPVFLDDIERIEISLSPLSALYGADAFGGIISIVTRPPEPGSRARVLVGDKNQQDYQAGYGWGSGLLTGRVSVGWAKAGGFGNTDPSKVREPVLGLTTRAADGQAKLKDWWDLSKVALSLDRESLAGGQFQLRAGGTFGEIAFPDLSSSLTKAANNHYPTWNAFTRAEYARPFATGLEWRGILSLSQAQDEGESQAFSTRREGAEFQLLGTFGKHHLAAGLSGELVEANSSAFGSKEPTDNLLALYLQEEYAATDNLGLNIGLRFDKHSDLAGRFSPRVSAVWSPLPGQTLRLGAGMAFRKPSFLESFADYSGGATPTTQVAVLGEVTAFGERKAERIDSLQLDYQGRLGQDWLLRVNFFRNEVRDLISLAKADPYPPYFYAVIYSAYHNLHIQGVETELRWAPSRIFQVFANASYQDLAYSSTLTTDRLGVPEWKGNAGFLFQAPSGIQGSLLVHRVGTHTPQFGHANTQGQILYMHIPPYTSVDAKFAWPRSFQAWSMELGCQALNLFNRKHMEFPISDGNNPYFGFSGTGNYTEEQKRMYENRNALNDRRVSLFFSARF
ncbi:MAG TPA: TonB-dependent receptor [Geothrix sp.]|nr:TonB-dependent receptor [Geothrix sp.]